MTIILAFAIGKIYAQQVVNEDVSNYSANSNLQIEAFKLNSGYIYSVVLNDSIFYSDTIFKVQDNTTHTLIISSDINNKLRWYVDIPRGLYTETIKSMDKISQLFEFSDSALKIRNKRISNPNLESVWSMMVIDSTGNNFNLIKIGNCYKDSLNSALHFNCFSVKSNGNYILGGYQLGSVQLLGNLYFSDTFLSTYFTLEIDQAGNLVQYKQQFRCLNPYQKISRGIENSDKIIFESNFDSLVIDNKNYSVLNYGGNSVSDLVLIALDKSTSSLSNYSIFKDSSTNGLASNGSIKSIGQSILWPVNSSTATVHVKDSTYSIQSTHDQLIILLNLSTFQPVKVYPIDAENPVIYDIDYFNDTSSLVSG